MTPDNIELFERYVEFIRRMNAEKMAVHEKYQAMIDKLLKDLK